jgi:Tol biopolymer transport system component
VTQNPPEYRGDPAAVLGAGSRIAGYRLEEQVGAGGMAVVCRARDERLGRLVALKIMAPAMAADALFRQRFTRESRAAAAVDHPHIIPVYEAGEADGVLFIAMRFVGGGDVGSLLRREGPLPPARAASIISPVASALDAAHAAGLVHRDVKPANMLLDTHPGRPDHVYLSDFGLSKGVQSGRLTASGQLLGTPDYIAPEQIEGVPVDGRADQYALACVAFELLTRAVIFARSEGWATVWAHLNSPPPPVTSIRPDLSPAVDEVLARALAKAPQDRYASCQQFADALREGLSLAPYHLGSGAMAATGGTGNGSAGPAAPDTANRLAPTASMATPPHGAAEPARAADMPRAAVTANPARGHRARPRRPRRRWIPIVLAGVVVVAAAGTAAVLAAPAHHARPAAVVSPVFSRVAAFTPPRTPGHWQDVSSVAFSPDGRTLATGLTIGPDGSVTASDFSGATYLWNVATRKRARILPGAGSAEAFSPDGKVLAAAGGTGQSILYLLDAATGKRVAELTGHLKVPITAMAYSPDGKVLAVDDLTGVVYLWNLVTRQASFTINGPGDPNGAAALAFSPNGRTLATLQNSGARNEVYLYNMTTVEKPAILANPGGSPVTSVSFSPDGKMFAVSGLNGRTSVYNTTTRKRLTTFADPGSFGVETAAFSPDSEMLATSDLNGKTYLWNLSTRTPAAVLANPGGTASPEFRGKYRNAVASIAFSPDGKMLATSDTNGSAYLWRIR